MPGLTNPLGFSLVLYLIAALGMQLMTFEDMTYELRRTNRRLEAMQNKLRRMVITDPLTGCRNRRFFEEVIGRELHRHLRYGIPMSILFVDVDRFKAVNDTLATMPATVCCAKSRRSCSATSARPTMCSGGAATNS